MNESWTPQSFCITCYTRLIEFSCGKKKYLSFGKPVEWRDPIDHVTDCYFCLTKVQGGKNSKVIYPDVRSVTNTQLHSSRFPKREPPKVDKKRSPQQQYDSDFVPSDAERDRAKQNLMSQIALSDLCRDLNLSKDKSEVLASRLQQRGFLEPRTRVTFYRSRNKKFEYFVSNKVLLLLQRCEWIVWCLWRKP